MSQKQTTVLDRIFGYEGKRSLFIFAGEASGRRNFLSDSVEDILGDILKGRYGK
jgi:hypothetical protein